MTLRANHAWNMIPGEIVTVNPRKQWSYAGHPYLSGEVTGMRLDVAAMGLLPLRLDDRAKGSSKWNRSSPAGYLAVVPSLRGNVGVIQRRAWASGSAPRDLDRVPLPAPMSWSAARIADAAAKWGRSATSWRNRRMHATFGPVDH